MNSNLVLAYAACGGLIVVHALGRFNTPPSNRSSTRQAHPREAAREAATAVTGQSRSALGRYHRQCPGTQTQPPCRWVQ